MLRPARCLIAVAFAGLALLFAVLGVAGPAGAHGFTSVVYADVTSGGSGVVRAKLELEYDLLVVSAADAGHEDALFREGTAAFEAHDTQEQGAALRDHREAVLSYVTGRFGVTAHDAACTPTQYDDFSMGMRDGVPYATVVLDYACPAADAHVVTSKLFPDGEGYVRGTRTIVTYDLDLRHGSAALDADQPSFSTHQSTGERFWEFFKLGAEHLLTGLDHILFLTALIAGSRRLREIVLAATTFTIAHSVTFVLAALGLVSVPSAVVEPIIALSIAVVAGWYLWRLVTRGSHAMDLETTSGSHFSLDRAGWTRLGVVFCFGLIHGLGFASALGIDAAWSWTLLWSLLVFNLGIEAVQLGIIALLFPVLALLRHRVPTVGAFVSGLIAAVVAAMGLVWFVQRLTSS